MTKEYEIAAVKKFSELSIEFVNGLTLKEASDFMALLIAELQVFKVIIDTKIKQNKSESKNDARKN